jgi:hypothetical protein
MHSITLSPLTLSRLENLPKPGGTHLWLAQVAGGLKRRISAADCARFLRAVCDRLVTHRYIKDREIEEAIDFAYSTTVGVLGKKLSWPEQNDDAIRELLSRTNIPVLFDADTDAVVNSQTAITGLFLSDEQVCIGDEVNQAVIKPVSAWVANPGLVSKTYICPNPMRDRFIKRSDGSIQFRCQSNVLKRRWLIVEADDKRITKNAQSKILSALSLLLPLKIVVDSGGKSLHGWFHVEGREWKEIVFFFYGACLLGADETKFDESGWVRLPGGTRRDGASLATHQRILYWDPTIVPQPVTSKKEESNA